MSRKHAIALLLAVSTAGCARQGEMEPGSRCGSCHGDQARAFTAAGTLYAAPLAAREEGLAGGRVDLLDSAGHLVTLRSNAAGNFYTRASLTPPLQVTVTRGDDQRAMRDAPHGDCNACHAGDAGGPGHIHLP